MRERAFWKPMTIYIWGRCVLTALPECCGVQQERYCKLKDSISNSLVKTGRSGTEQVLWHGPSSLAAMEGIVVRGFDRMFSHRGANAYGKGCYFARDLMIADRYAAR